MQPAQCIFVNATDGQDLLQCFIGESIHRSAQTLEQLTPIPFQRLIEFSFPQAGAVVLQQGLIGIGSRGVLQAMLASVRVLFDFVAFVVEAQQVLILVPVQAFFTDDAIPGQGDRLLI
ncbi:hypothetical protein D3C78_511260 [compost metagenome]